VEDKVKDIVEISSGTIVAGAVSIAAVVAAGVAAAFYASILRRMRRFQSSLSAERRSGVDATGELTVGAKYAIWRHILGILGIGGTVVGIAIGVAG
jgi:hypothetical protein